MDDRLHEKCEQLIEASVLGSGRGCPLVVHYWADLQSVHGLRCYANITRTRNVSEYTLVSLVVLLFLCGDELAGEAKAVNDINNPTTA